VEGQTLLPHTTASGNPIAQGTFTPTASTSNPTAAFGWNIDGEKSDDSLNAAVATNPQDQGHHVRFFPARDASGKVIPNTWLMAMDYLGINYDYQDNVYLVTNMRPENPAAPTAPAVTGQSPGVQLTWMPSASPTASGYNVYRSDTDTGTFVKVNTTSVAAAGYVDLATLPGQTYYYRVTTVDNWGGESGPSAVVSGTRAADSDAPATPVGFTATGTPDGVMLSWTANTEADMLGYRLYRALVPGGPYDVLNGGATVGFTQSLDSTAVDGVTYYYKITAVDTTGNESIISATVQGKRLPPPDVTPPAAPTNLGASGQQNGIVLTWDANTDSDLAGYRVFRSSTAGGTFALLTTGQPVVGQLFVDTTASAGKTYFYRIVAVDTAGNASASSNDATATRPYPDPVRINAAGQTFTDALGHVWNADKNFSGGTTSTGAYDVLGTTDDALYYTRRYGNFNYNLAMPDGAYKVNLYFADPVYTQAGKRKFDVFAEGKQILDDFDIAANGGGKTAISRGFNVNVVGGALTLQFKNVLDNAMLSAVEILPIGDTVAPSIPKRATATGSQAGIKLDWNDNLESDLAGYNVYRSDDAEGTYAKLNGSPLTISEYMDAAAPAGTASYYRITAVDIYGNESSPVFAYTTRPNDTTPPATPANLAATGSSGGIALSWNANSESDFAGYNVYRQDATSGQFVKLNASPLAVTAYADSSAPFDATTTYRVTAVDKSGNESAPGEASAYRPPAPVAGTGLKAEYYDNSNLTTLKLTRTDAQVNFDWSTGSPDPSIGVDTFSVRWTGQIQAAASGSYTFTLHADDGVRMWVNGVLVIDKFVNASTNKDQVSTAVQLTAGQKADIKIEYFENTGGAFCQLYWQSATVEKQLVPTEALFPPGS
jgi:fibronectin type 3 domain-containing protein